MFRLLLRRPRPTDPASSHGSGPLALTVVAVVTGIALVGCGGAVRDALDQATGARSSNGASAVAPMGEKAAFDVGPATSSSAPQSQPAGAPGVVPAPDLPTAGEGRQIIRSGTAELEVRSVAEAFESVRQIATGAGGMVADSSFTGSGDRESAHLTLRVPVDRFGDVIVRLRDVAVEVRSITTGSNDVTEEVTDIEATIRNLRAVEAQYVQLLSRTGSIAEVLSVQDRLNQVRLQIDRTEARRQSLAARAEMSTITVSLSPVGANIEGRGALASARAAWAASLETLAFIGTAVLVAVVYSWWLIPIVAVGLIVARRAWRRAHVTADAPPAAL
jgi:hypothetical protein